MQLQALLHTICIYYLAMPCVYHHIGKSSAFTLNHTWQKVVHRYLQNCMHGQLANLIQAFPGSGKIVPIQLVVWQIQHWSMQSYNWALPSIRLPAVYLMSSNVTPGLPPPFFSPHTASNQKLEPGKAWEWGYQLTSINYCSQLNVNSSRQKMEL